MNSITFVLISVASGVVAGLILAGLNLLVVEPLMDKAIEIETTKAVASGENIDFEEFDLIRVWQKSGTFIACALLGMAFGSVLGIVYLFSHKVLPFSSDRKNAILLALIICIVLFVVPFLKYPGNPPAVGDPETIYLRETWYIGYLSVSCLSALGLGIVYGRLKNLYKHINIIIPIIYVAIVACAFMIFPANPDKILISMDLVNSFRIVTGLTMVTFWIVLGISFGILWQRFQPNRSSVKTISI